MKRVLITCQETHRLLSEHMDRPLPLGMRLRLKLHLSLCHVCSRVERQFNGLRSAIRRLGP
ncbi:MAG TPA: zf-HC2 domain-containing protein [Burkholderiaceae bacterium]|nr:zf-HC2 domain-containing protein [Burkholderiaceae bacterium]